MKRVVLCIIFLIAIIIFSSIMMTKIKKQNDTLISKIDAIVTIWNEGNPELAKQYAENANQYWKEYYNMASYVISQDKLTCINDSITRMNSLISLDNDEFIVESEAIKASLKLLFENESLSFANVI